MSLPRPTRLAALLAIAFATHATPGRAIDLLDSYRLATQSDGQLKAARARAEAGREALPQAIGQLLPNVSASYSRGDVEQDQRRGKVTLPTVDYVNEAKIITLSQPIYRQYQFSQVGEARAKVRGADAQLTLDTQDMGTRVVTAYFDALFQRDRLSFIQAQRASVSAQLASAKLAFAAGTGTRTDIDEAQAKLDVLAADEIQARQAIEASDQQLAIFIGQPVEGIAGIDTGRLEMAAFEPGDLLTWLERAGESSPEVRVQRSRVDQTQAEIGMAKAGHYPTVDAVARYSDTLSESPFVVGNEFTTRFIGVQVNIPIFSGFKVNSQVRQAVATHVAAREQLQSTLNDVQLRVRREYNNVREGQSRVRALETAVRSAEQVVLSNRKGVEAGTRTTLDVLNVEQQRYNTQVELARARYSLLVSWSRLTGLAGSLDETEVTRLNTVLRAAAR
jgi:outer membrane protein/protease secretion system outer membrane protein